MDLGPVFRSIDANEFRVSLRGKGHHKPEFGQDIVCAHSLIGLTGLIEYNTESLILRCCHFMLKLRAGDIKTTGVYMNYPTYSNLQIIPLAKKIFHSNHTDLRNISDEITPFLSVGIIGFVLMFRKAFKFHFERKRRYTIFASRQGEIPFWTGSGRQRGRGFIALAQLSGKTAIPISPKLFVSIATPVVFV